MGLFDSIFGSSEPEDIKVKLLDGTEKPLSEVSVGEVYINEKGEKVTKEAVKQPDVNNSKEEIIVTLLDGTKVPKKDVPIGVVYINEKGQKVKKVLKQPNSEPPKEETKGFLGGIGDWVTQAAKDTADWTVQAAKDTADWTSQAAKDTADWTSQAAKDTADWTVQAAKDTADWTSQAAKDTADWTVQAAKDTANFITNIPDSAKEYALETITKLLGKIDIDAITTAFEQYSAESGKDITATLNFLYKLKDLQKDGK